MLKTPKSCGVVAGTIIFFIHLALAAYIFASVHQDRVAQAEFAWFLFMRIDFPICNFAWDYVATTRPFEALMDWGYTWGSGPNLRAFAIHGIFGGAQWFGIGALLGFFFWPKRGYIAIRRPRVV